MEYIEQEIEMLARYSWECENASEWTGATLRERRNEANAVAEALDGAETLEGQRIRAAARLMREAREQGAAERAKYRADDVVLARSPLAASCVRQGVTAQAAANAFEYELHDLTQEFSRFKTNSSAAMTIKFDAVSADLIGKAREQGAAEMREMAANEAQCPAFRASYDASAIACRISVLPLTVSS